MVDNVSVKQQALEIEINNTTITLPLIWLRDYCQCSECVHVETKQRLLSTYSLPEILEVKGIGTHDNQLTIDWGHENHTSVYTTEFLLSLCRNPESLNINRVLWTSRTLLISCLVCNTMLWSTPTLVSKNFLS